MIAAIYACKSTDQSREILKPTRCRMNRVFCVVIGSLAIAWAPIVWTQPRVDFSGTWTLDIAKSGPLPAGLRPGTLRIEQSATELKSTASDGRNTVTTILKLDGTPTVTEFGTATVTWDGPRLIVRSVSRFPTPQGDLELESTETYSLTASVLTITSSGTIRNSGDRFPASKMIFTKQ